ncbi:MAG TPA: hypothetical protein VK154_07570, partial [Chitinophagales bacterium]|nr:hypothetical protein [Chitinophagales bacterium]
MKKHMLPGTIALFKRLALVAIVALIFTPASIYGQCNIAQEIPSVNAPSGCSDGSFSLGSGAYYDLPISQNTYYNWTFSESTANISGFCAAPNGTTSSGSFSANTNNWFSGDATSIRMSPNRSSGTWTGSSAVFTYRYSQPTATAIVASPNPACQGSNVTLDATASLAYFFGWSGAGGYSSSPTSNPDVVVSNVQTSGTYTLTA